jgi:uncharacterized protein (DUF2062 family)
MRQVPRRKHLAGGRLHRLFGDRLFDARLWRPTRETFAGGFALGLIVGLLPTFYLQVVLSLVFSYIFRLNVSAAILGTLITNPVTTPPILVLQYQLGVLLVGSPTPEELERYAGILKIVLGHARPYLVGSVVSSLAAGLAGYVLILLTWDGTLKIGGKLFGHGGRGHRTTTGEKGTSA